MIERTFDKLVELSIVFALLAIAIGVLFWLWQKAEKACKEDEKSWQAEFKDQEMRHAADIKALVEKLEISNKARLDGALDMLAFVRNMEDAIKKGDVREAISELHRMVRKIAKHQNIDID
jgi:hypothetical protein